MAEGIFSQEPGWNVKASAAKVSLRCVKFLEWLGSLVPSLGHWYAKLFYGRMIAAERRAAGLQPGAKVLHIGSGRLPMTALTLAAQGFAVTALDNDPAAVGQSRRVLRQCGLQHQVQVVQADGSWCDCSDYDAVWISFHVIPKQGILQQVLQSLRPNSCVIYRNPRGWLRRFYPSVAAAQLNPDCCLEGCLQQNLGKESIILRKGDVPCKH